MSDDRFAVVALSLTLGGLVVTMLSLVLGLRYVALGGVMVFVSGVVFMVVDFFRWRRRECLKDKGVDS